MSDSGRSANVSPAAVQPRLPLEPLVRMYGSISMLARATGRHASQVSKWNREGVPLVSADRLAIALGMHPIEVWPNWYEIDAAA